MSRSFVLFIALLLGTGQLFGQALEHKPNQIFISPELSLGSPIIINQNNYGYDELGLDFTFGGHIGVMVGWDYYLKRSFKTGLLVSKWGQHYSDVIRNAPVSKNINAYYLQVPAIYKHVFGRKRGYDHEVYSPYIYGGVQAGWLFLADVAWKRNNEDLDMISFLNEYPDNQNLDEIINQGNPSKDKHLFFPVDLNLLLGGGFQYFVTRRTSLFADISVTSSLLDINGLKWRFRNENDRYSGSYNLYVGINLGANIYLFKNRR